MHNVQKPTHIGTGVKDVVHFKKLNSPKSSKLSCWRGVSRHLIY